MKRRSFLATPLLAGMAPAYAAAGDSRVIATGDGIPHSPEEYAGLLDRLSVALKPDDYSLGGIVAQLEQSVAASLGKEYAVWLPTGTLANHLAVRLLAGERRRVLVQHTSAGGVSETALEQALAFVDKLKELDARFYRMYPIVSAQLDRLRKLPHSYLTHELLTRNWQAFSFADVATELADAKLAYLGSAYLVDHVDRINFTEPQQRFLAQVADPLLAETTRDMIIGRQFRRDIFIKGFTPLAPLQARERWLQTRLALSVAAEDLALTFQTALGTLALRPDIYKPVIDVLDRGPLTIRELIEQLPANQLSWTSLTDAIMVLIGLGELHPALPTDNQAERAASTSAFNTAVMTRAKESTELGYLASPVTGGGIRADRISQLYLLAKQKGLSDPAGAMARIAITSGHTIEKDGKKLAPEDATTVLVARAAEIEQRTLPMLARLGINSPAVEKTGTHNL